MKKYYSVMIKKTIEVCIKAESEEDAEEIAEDNGPLFDWEMIDTDAVSCEEGIYDAIEDEHLIAEFKQENRYAE